MGEYAEGVRNGEGKFTYKNGDIYEGPWKDDKRHGVGKYTFASGKVKNGRFDKGDFKEWLE